MPPVQTTITCPNCRQPITAQIQQLFDVSKDSSDKQRFLRGGFNAIHCPLCGYQGQVAVPMVYHDADRELLLVHVPIEVNLPKPGQEKVIGRLINQAIANLPPERRKGYLFNPTSMLTMQSMVERVLEGEGITREMLDTQRKRTALLQELLRTPSEQVPEVVKTRDAELDEMFFQLLASAMAAATAGGDRTSADRLANLNEQLLSLSGYGKDMLSQAREAESAARDLQALGRNLTLEKFVDLVAKAPNKHRVAALVGLMRPAVDYNFFQELTRRIERTQGPEKTRLSLLRDQILDLTKQIDQAARQRATEAAELLRSLLEAPDPEAAIQENLQAIDDTFMAVLSANLDAAEKAGRRDVVERLAQLGEQIMGQLQAASPPELQFVNELLNQPSQAQAEALIKQRAGEVDERTLEALRYVAGNLRENNQTEMAERLERLETIAIREMMAAKWKSRAQA